MASPVLTSIPFLPSQVATPDVNTELTTFELALLTAYMGLQPPELVKLGLQLTTGALQWKMPISVGSAIFRLLTGGIQYRRLGELMLPISPLVYADGVTAEVLKIQSDAWTGWGDQPATMAEAAGLIGEAGVATALMTGDTTQSVENWVNGDTGQSGIFVFGQNKAVDPLGGNSQTYSNKATSTGDANGNFAAAGLNLADIDRIWGNIHSVLSQNGKDYRDLEWVATIVARPLELLARRYFENQGDENKYIIESSGSSTAQVSKPNTARSKGIKVFSSPYITQVDRYWAVCTTRTQKRFPWVELTQVPARQPPLVGMIPTGVGALNGAGLEIIIDDVTSEGYKHGTDSIPIGHVGVAAKRRVGVGITCPWQIFEILNA